MACKKDKSFGLATVYRMVNLLEELGISPDKVHKMLVLLPSIFGFKIETLNEKINNIESLGFTRQNVVAIISRAQALFSINFEGIKSRFNEYIALGYTQEELVIMIKRSPTMLTITSDKAKSTYNLFAEFFFKFSINTGAKASFLASTNFKISIYAFFLKIKSLSYFNLYKSFSFSIFTFSSLLFFRNIDLL